MQTTSVEQTAQNDALMDAMKKYPKLSSAKIDKFVKPLRMMHAEQKICGNKRVVNMHCSCGWSSTKEYNTKAPVIFGLDGRCPKCGSMPERQRINGREIYFGEQYLKPQFPSKTVVYLEKANLPNDAMLVRYFRVSCNFRDETPNITAQEIKRAFITSNDCVIFQRNEITGNIDNHVTPLLDDTTDMWCFQTEQQIQNLRYLSVAKIGILECWDIMAVEYPESPYLLVGNLNTVTVLQTFPEAQFFIKNGYISIFNKIARQRRQPIKETKSPYEIVGCSKEMFDKLAVHFPGRKLTMDIISEAKTFCKGDVSNTDFFAQAKKNGYAGELCDFTNIAHVSTKEAVRLVENTSKTFGMRRNIAAKMLYKYADVCKKIGVKPDFTSANIKRDTYYAETILNLLSYEVSDCFLEANVVDSITPAGCRLINIDREMTFTQIVYENKDKDFVQRFFSEIVDIYMLFPDLYEDSIIKTIDLVMEDDKLRSIVVLAYGETAKTANGKEVIYKVEYSDTQSLQGEDERHLNERS